MKLRSELEAQKRIEEAELTSRKLKEEAKLAAQRLKDEAEMAAQKLREEAELHLSYDDVESIMQLEREGKTHLIIGLDRNKNMTGKVDLIEAEEVDDTVAMHLRRGGGMFVA